jgi:hypothetical protein
MDIATTLDVIGKLEFDALVSLVLFVIATRVFATPLAEVRQAFAHPAKPLTDAIELPEDVLSYCSQEFCGENETWCQDECKNRARNYYAESASWPVVLTTLQREDGEIK